MSEKRMTVKRNYRVATFTLLAVVELSYIAGIAYTLLINEGDCNQPLRLWLKALCLVYSVHFVLLTFTEILTPHCANFLSSKICAVSAAFNTMLCIVMFAWFILGNYWYFNRDSLCSDDFYEGEMATFIILIVYYVFLGSTCCLGCLMVIFICLGCGITNRAADY